MHPHVAGIVGFFEPAGKLASGSGSVGAFETLSTRAGILRVQGHFPESLDLSTACISMKGVSIRNDTATNCIAGYSTMVLAVKLRFLTVKYSLICCWLRFDGRMPPP